MSFDEPEDDDLIARLAALDDCLGGHSGGQRALRELERNRTVPADGDAIEALLLLRQTAADEASPVQSNPPLPQRIGRFEVVRQSGSGGFAVVYEAIDPALNRRVAIKVARPEAVSTPEIRRRFVREAEMAVRLTHPHLVTILEVGEDEGLPYIAQEFCPAGSLAQWLERHPGPVSPRVAAGIVAAIGQAVDHAHAHGIVHRDIKPANLMLVPVAGESAVLPDEGLTVKLCDFGLAKSLESADVGESAPTRLTQTGMRLGTPAWMAPEQIDSSFGEIGPQTDVHALGLILDRLLTGRRLRSGETEAETLKKVLLDEPPAANRLVVDVPGDLAAVCLKAIEKRPSDRFQSAGELSDELLRFLAGRATLTRPQKLLARALRQVRRRPLIAALSAVLAATAAAGLWSTRANRSELQRADLEIDSLQESAAAEDLLEAFNSARTGFAAKALKAMAECARKSPALASSFGGRMLGRRLHGEVATLLQTSSVDGGPPPAISALALSRDRSLAAVGAANDRLYVLSLQDAAPPTAVNAGGSILSLAFSPDGERIAATFPDGAGRVWNTSDRSLIGEFRIASKASLSAVAFDDRGQTIFCGGADRTIWVVDAGGELPPRALATLPAGRNETLGIKSICTAGPARVAAAVGAEVHVVDLATGRLVHTLIGNGGQVTRLAASEDGSRLLAVGTEPRPRLWDLETGAALKFTPTRATWPAACGISPDGTQIAIASPDGFCRIFSTTKDRLIGRLFGHVGPVIASDFETTGHVISAGVDGSLRRWDPAAQDERGGFREQAVAGGAVRSLAPLPDDGGPPRAVMIQAGVAATVVEAGSPPRFTPFPTTIPSPSHAAVDAPRHRIALASGGASIRVEPLPGCTSAIGQVPGGDDIVAQDLAWTVDGRLIAGCADGRLLAWDAGLSDASEIDRLGGPIEVVVASPSGRPRVAAGHLRTVVIHDLGDQSPPANPRQTIPLPANICSAAWSPDGLRLVCGTIAGDILIFSTDTGDLLGDIHEFKRNYENSVKRSRIKALVPLEIAFTPGGRTLLICDAERIWFADANTRTWFESSRPDWQIACIAVSADEELIMLGGEQFGEGRIGLLDVSLPPIRRVR